MDATDRKILAELQNDGRMSLTDLAERVQLSLSPCHRRLRALEQSGAISGYRAHLDAGILGLKLESLVFVTMDAGRIDTLTAFEEELRGIPNVLKAQRLFGDPDYLLHVVATDMEAFQKLYDERLSALPGVRRLNSTLVMKNIVDNAQMPL